MTKKMIDRGKRSKTLSDDKPVENISRNLQSFLEISPVQKEVLLLNKLQDHAFESCNLFRLKEDNSSQNFVFKLVFTPCKAEQPLRGMELQEKEAQKG